MASLPHVEAIWAAALLLLLGLVVSAPDEGKRDEDNVVVRAGLAAVLRFGGVGVRAEDCNTYRSYMRTRRLHGPAWGSPRRRRHRAR